MAVPTAVNSQITDAITQTNVKVLGEAPGKVRAPEGALYYEAVLNSIRNS